MWAETGDFRDTTHSSMTAVANSLDHTQLGFQSSSIRSRSRDRKNDGKCELLLVTFGSVSPIFIHILQNIARPCK